MGAYGKITPMKTKETRGILAIIVSVMIGGLIGVFSRLIGMEFGAFAQHWLKNVVALTLAFAYLVVFKKTWQKIKLSDLRTILPWTLSGSLTMVILFVAFNHMDTGTVFLSYYSFWLLSNFLLGRLLFDERLNLKKTFSIALVILGLFLIYSFNLSFKNLPYLMMSVLAGVLSGLWTSLSKKNSDRFSNIQMIIVDGLTSFSVGLLGFFIAGEVLPSFQMRIQWIGVGLYGISTLIGVATAIYGFKQLEVQVTSVLTSLQVVFGVFFGFFLAGDNLPLVNLLGAILIVLASSLPHLKL